MPKSDSAVLMPILSPGKHRRLRDGACFMEFASWLAGESWSDHPACTHPALASLARLVNDCSTGAGRARLVELIPSVIGLVNDDPLTNVVVAARAAGSAIFVASEERQRALATGLLCLERHLRADDDATAFRVRSVIADALARVPAAKLWAEDFSLGQQTPRPREIVRVCEAMLRVSVVGIAEACISDPDAILRDLLGAAIADLAPRSRQQAGSLQETSSQQQAAQHSRERILQSA